MRRKSLILALLVVVTLFGVVSLTLILLLRHEPAFYRRGALAANMQRREWSNEFYLEFSHLFNTLQHDEEEVWGAQFTTEQINSYLREGLMNYENLLPKCVSELRVALDTDRLRLGFRYGSGRWSTIITIDMRFWVAQGQPNTVGLELLGLYAGALPISAQSLLEQISEAARQLHNLEGRKIVDVCWYRHNGHPVALLRFGPDQPRATIHLQHVELQEGKLLIQGCCGESSARGMARPAEPTSTAAE